MTIKSANARLNVYEEAIGHLEMTLSDYDKVEDKEEIEETKILISKLKKVAKSFQDRYFG